MSGFFGGIFTAYKTTNVMGITTAVAALVNIVINIVFIPSIGTLAAALSTLVANIVGYIWRVEASKKYMVVKEDLLYTIIQIASVIVIFAMFYHNTSCSIVVMCIYSLIVSVFMNWELIKTLFKYIKSKKSI